MNGLGAKVALRLASGERADRALSADGHLELQAAVLHGERLGLIEVVAASRADGRLRFGDRERPQNYLAAGDRRALVAAVSGHREARREVFMTPATLTEPRPGNEAVAESWVAWVDVDSAEGLERLRRFERRPQMVVITGGSEGAHAYWRLAEPLAGEDAEALNRKLAGALGGDVQCANRGRIMRCAGTVNYKRERPQWCRVVMADLGAAPWDPASLGGGLTDPRERRGRAMARARARVAVDDPYKGISAVEYFRRLAGVAVPRDGLVSCPSPDHEDRHPSCSVGDDVWCCFSSGAGGSIYDLASVLEGGPYGQELRDEDFRRARAAVVEAFGELDTRPNPRPEAAARR